MADGKNNEGWLAFAIAMAMIGGSMNAVFGLVALFAKEGFADNSTAFVTLQQWGWILILVGVLEFAIAFMLSARKNSARIIGIVIAALSLLAWVGWTGALPLAGITAIVINILIIYALSVTRELFQ